MNNQITDEDLALLGELEIDISSDQTQSRSDHEQRIIAGFEEIERFVLEHERLPQHGEERDIFERLYAVRLDRLRESEECRSILESIDHYKLLGSGDHRPSRDVDISDEALLTSLGIDVNDQSDVTRLVHVRSRTEIRAAENVAQRTICTDFERFNPIFDRVQQQIDAGIRQSVKYQDNAEVNQGDMFILDGQRVLVAEMDELFIGDHGRPDRRLRLIYDNATESNLLLRSLQRALNKDKASRRIIEVDFGPLFSDIAAEDDISTGIIYVLRSKSDHPFIAENRRIIHKIGVTGGDVEKRIAGAKHDSTYLFAEVDIVARFRLLNINRRGFEILIQNFFRDVQLDITLHDRFGRPVRPREWFLVPLPVIEEVIEKIIAGTIEQFFYDQTNARLQHI